MRMHASRRDGGSARMRRWWQACWFNSRLRSYCSRSVQLTSAWLGRRCSERSAACGAALQRAAWALQPFEVRGRDDVTVADGRDRDDRPAAICRCAALTRCGSREKEVGCYKSSRADARSRRCGGLDSTDRVRKWYAASCASCAAYLAARCADGCMWHGTLRGPAHQ